MKKKSIKNLDQLLDHKYGKKGTEKRNEFEINSKSFIIGELIKAERIKAKMTQEQLAKKVHTKKSYISRIENGKSDIQFSTLLRIIEEGLGRQIYFGISN